MDGRGADNARQDTPLRRTGMPSHRSVANISMAGNFGVWLEMPATIAMAAPTVRDHPTAPRSPWQNGNTERTDRSIRRECLDHIVVFGEAHLRRILAGYAGYYNELRTHLSLNKDPPDYRPVQRFGQFAARPILGGLHHERRRQTLKNPILIELLSAWRARGQDR